MERGLEALILWGFFVVFPGDLCKDGKISPESSSRLLVGGGSNGYVHFVEVGKGRRSLVTQVWRDRSGKPSGHSENFFFPETPP